MKKAKTKKIWWLISPSYKYAEKKKHALIDMECSKYELSCALREYNKRYLRNSIVLCIVSGLLIPLGHFLYDGGFYADQYAKYILGVAVVFVVWIFLLSRMIEIFKAFLDDAVEKLDNKDPSSDLKYGQRLKLSFNSYIELIINAATLYYLVPSSFFRDSYEFSSVIEALYFSGVTITTLGYGDVSPSNPALQLFTIFQVLTGFILIIVCFAIYSSLALSQRKA